MKRVLCCLVAVTLTSSSGAVARGQQSTRAADPGILARHFSPVSYLKALNPGQDDHLGFGSALMGRTLALSRDGNVMVASSMLQGGGGRGVSANQKDVSAPESGAVYVFTRAAGQWTQRAYLKSPNSDAYDEFGGAVGLSGDANTLAVSARGEDGGSAGVNGNQADNSVRGSGAVYVY